MSKSRVRGVCKKGEDGETLRRAHEPYDPTPQEAPRRSRSKVRGGPRSEGLDAVWANQAKMGDELHDDGVIIENERAGRNQNAGRPPEGGRSPTSQTVERRQRESLPVLESSPTNPVTTKTSAPGRLQLTTATGAQIGNPDSPTGETAPEANVSKRRWTQPVYQAHYAKERAKIAEMPGMRCVTCMVQNNCPSYDEARTSCVYETNFDAFSARDVDNILGRMEFLANDSFRRYQRSRLAEDLDEGGLPNPRTSELAALAIQTHKDLNEMRADLGDDAASTNAGAKKQGGILSQAISMMMSQSTTKTAKITLEETRKDEDE